MTCPRKVEFHFGAVAIPTPWLGQDKAGGHAGDQPKGIILARRGGKPVPLADTLLTCFYTKGTGAWDTSRKEGKFKCMSGKVLYAA